MNTISRHVLLIACSAILSVSTAVAQYEFFATLNDVNLSVNRIANIPPIFWVVGNAAYDENHHRYFFQGNGTNASPWDLYTIDAVTGAVISMPQAPSNFSTGSILGLQYDNIKDTLYAIYLDGKGGGYFSWISPADAVAHTIKSIPSFSGFTESTYDEKDHVYILNSGDAIVAIDASTGNVLHSSTPAAGTHLSQLVYNNSDGRLYGILTSGLLASPQFDSITVATAAAHTIASLPPVYFPDINAYAIHESSGKYVFVGTDPVPTGCINDYFYVVDIHTGAVLSKTLYPYAQNSALPSFENVLDYCYDQSTNILYALNWHPSPSTSNPFIFIIASDNPACPGATIVFTANPGSSVVNPSYQWFVNGVNTGMTGPAYSRDDLVTGDTVYCVMSGHSPCTASTSDTSNRIAVIRLNTANASVDIDASAIKICSGDTVQFTAHPTNGGSDPQYQWLIDGVNTGMDNDLLTTGALADGDTVSCIMTSSLSCTQPVPSTNSITMTVNPRPVIKLEDNFTISRGQSIDLNPSITGTIALSQWTPPTGLSDPDISDPVATPLTTTTYLLRVTADNGCSSSAKTTINIVYTLQMPNAFTPNGDGRNDLFRIPPSTPEKVISFTVYNRWGQIVFFTAESSRGWDGTMNGHPQPAGSYVWKIEYADASGARKLASGNVILVR